MELIMKILVTPTSMKPDSDQPALKKLREFAGELVFNETGKPLREDALTELLQDCDGCLAGLDLFTEQVLEQCPKLKVISRYGAGYDQIDLKAAAKKGIRVSNTPGANAEAVGELAFGMAMALARNLVMLDRKTKENQWVRAKGIELYQKKIGIIGLGAIGKVVARCAKGMGMEILAYDPFLNETYCKEHGIKGVSLNELYEQSDVISLHLPLNEKTRYLINEESLKKCKKGVLLINASRGGLLDEKAVEQALKEGRIGGLGLDAFEQEPPGDSPLLHYDNVVATPHTGAHTVEATEQMAAMAVDNLIALLKEEDCPYVVNQ